MANVFAIEMSATRNYCISFDQHSSLGNSRKDVLRDRNEHRCEHWWYRKITNGLICLILFFYKNLVYTHLEDAQICDY